MSDVIIQLPPDSTGKKQRGYQRGTLTTDPIDMYVIPTKDRIITNNLRFSTYRVPATNATNHNLLTIENTAASTTLVGIQELSFETQVSAGTAMPIGAEVRAFRTAVTPTGGTILTPHQHNTSDPEVPATVIIRQANASDGGAATAIVHAVPTGNPFWSQAIDKIMNSSGQFITDDSVLLSVFAPIFTLRPGETLLVAVNGAIPTSYHYTVRGHIELYTKP